jgi:hypothetical protein
MIQFLFYREHSVYVARDSGCLQTGRSGDRIPVGGDIFRPLPDRPWVQYSLVYNGSLVFFTGTKQQGSGVDYTI